VSRTFFVKFNIDSFRNAMAALDGEPDSAYRDWMRGFNRAVGGKEPTTEAGPLRMGMEIGWACFLEAEAFRGKQSEKGRKSASARSATAQPWLNHGSTMAQPTPQPDPQPANSQQLSSTNEQQEAINHFELPTKSGVGYRLPRKLYDSLLKAYPDADLEGELAKMVAWLLANPAKAKTTQGMPRFINSWLQRSNPPAQRESQPTGWEPECQPTAEGIQFCLEEMARLRAEGKM
jgi:hypothetical protein